MILHLKLQCDSQSQCSTGSFKHCARILASQIQHRGLACIENKTREVYIDHWQETKHWTIYGRIQTPAHLQERQWLLPCKWCTSVMNDRGTPYNHNTMTLLIVWLYVCMFCGTQCLYRSALDCAESLQTSVIIACSNVILSQFDTTHDSPHLLPVFVVKQNCSNQIRVKQWNETWTFQGMHHIMNLLLHKVSMTSFALRLK